MRIRGNVIFPVVVTIVALLAIGVFVAWSRSRREDGFFDKIGTFFGNVGKTAVAAGKQIGSATVQAYTGSPSPSVPPPMSMHPPPPPLQPGVRVTPEEMRKFTNRSVWITPAYKQHCPDRALSTAWCAAGTNYIDLWKTYPDGVKWIVLLVPNTTDLFYLLPENRADCEDAMSVKSECASSTVDMWRARGGNQMWRFHPVQGKPDTFYIEAAAQSRTGCNRFLSVRSSCDDRSVDLWNSTGQNQEWKLDL